MLLVVASPCLAMLYNISCSGKILFRIFHLSHCSTSVSYQLGLMYRRTCELFFLKMNHSAIQALHQQPAILHINSSTFMQSGFAADNDFRNKMNVSLFLHKTFFDHCCLYFRFEFPCFYAFWLMIFLFCFLFYIKALTG